MLITNKLLTGFQRVFNALLTLFLTFEAKKNRPMGGCGGLCAAFVMPQVK